MTSPEGKTVKPNRSREILILAVALAMLVIDQVTKALVRKYLIPNVPWDPAAWLAPVLSLTYVTNRGAAFGLFPWLGSVYSLVNVFVIAMIVFFYRQLPPNNRWLQLSLGLQLGGALGNLTDRLTRGFVTDFVDLNFWPVHEWPVFNVADSCLTVGVCILALYLLLEKEQPSAVSSPSH